MSERIEIKPGLTIGENEFELSFIRSSGPGGQHVNKSSTAVQLQFDIMASSLNPGIKQRLIKMGGKRVSADKILTLTANQHRSQLRNREDAIARLVELIKKAAHRPKKRRKTKPSKAAKERRLIQKKQHSQTKKNRRKVDY